MRSIRGECLTKRYANVCGVSVSDRNEHTHWTHMSCGLCFYKCRRGQLQRQERHTIYSRIFEGVEADTPPKNRRCVVDRHTLQQLDVPQPRNITTFG